METSYVINISKILQDDVQQYLIQCVDMYTTNKNYDIALKIAKLADIPVNNILTAEWTHKYESLLMREEGIEDKDITLFIAQCSEAFKSAVVPFKDTTEFLITYVNKISDAAQKFYSYKIIINWFEENLEYGRKREEIEHLMWDAYFKAEHGTIILSSQKNTLDFILSGQKDANLMSKASIEGNKRTFSLMLHEIEVESDVGNIEDVVLLEEPEAIDNWRRVVYRVLELGLLVDAFRLSTLFKTPAEYKYKPPACPVQIVRTCLKLAEGTCSPYELPQELRLVISSPVLQNKLSSKCTLIHKLYIIYHA